MKLRVIISSYALWLVAIAVAIERGYLYPWEGDAVVLQIQDHLRTWLGEDLLNRRI